jgi:hypothetical protein
MSKRDERVDKAMAELQRVDDARLAALVDGRAANAMFEEVVGMTEPTTEQSGRAGRAAGARRAGTRRPRLLWRVGIAAAVVAVLAGVLAVVNPFESNGLTLVQQAAAALTPADGQILHVKMLGEQTNPDGSVVTWSDESWQATRSPYDRRQIETSPQGTVAETAMIGGLQQLYDAATDTIYVESPEKTVASAPPVPRVSGVPSFDKVTRIGVKPGSTDATITVTITGTVDGAVRTVHKTIGARKAKTLLAALVTRNPDIVAGGSSEEASSDAGSAGAQADADPFRDKILSLLQSGQAREDGRLTVDGREAIRFVRSNSGSTEVYIVDAATYTPIEFRTTGDGGGTVLRFVVYEKLSDSSATRGLLDLKAQHPDARIDTDPAAYEKASGRLFPNG